MSPLKDAQRAAARLSSDELRELARWIEQRLARAAGTLEADGLAPEPAAGPTAPGTIVEERVVGHKTFRLQYIRCGKPGCLCSREQGHGPYWYAFWREDGRVRSQYIGKQLD